MRLQPDRILIPTVCFNYSKLFSLQADDNELQSTLRHRVTDQREAFKSLGLREQT